ncbi:hypothetical protein [Embleya hyalina]|uniref:hypothetical protein n=1 Tax=Embleya hyalina TaxID=516124 RepID=UPI001FEC7890|nr:hypothetical protein [Embleya hyalina]
MAVYGSAAQQTRPLPDMLAGQRLGGLGISERHGESETPFGCSAVKADDGHVVTGVTRRTMPG